MTIDGTSKESDCNDNEHVCQALHVPSPTWHDSRNSISGDAYFREKQPGEIHEGGP